MKYIIRLITKSFKTLNCKAKFKYKENLSFYNQQGSTPVDSLADNLMPNGLNQALNCPLDYLQVQMTAFVSLFIAMIPIDCKITDFPYPCLFTFL